MGTLWQYLRSITFNTLMYLGLLGYGLAYLPFALVHEEGAYRAVRGYSRFVRLIARYIVGMRTEIRGEVPQGECLIAAKHQSFLDILMIVSVVPKPKFIMKAQLKYAPVLGYYAKRIGCIAVDRGRRAEAMRQMKEGVAKGHAQPGQLIIFPQGTRVAAGAKAPFKIGVGVLYDQLDQVCYPAATNVGVFWPRRGVLRKKGLAVVEFLPPIAPGMEMAAFMTEIEQVIEERSNALMAEAGIGA